MGKQRRKYTDDYKASAVERLYEPGATQGSVSNELGTAEDMERHKTKQHQLNDKIPVGPSVPLC